MPDKQDEVGNIEFDATSTLDKMLSQSNNILIIKAFQDKLDINREKIGEVLGNFDKQMILFHQIGSDIKSLNVSVNSTYTSQDKLMALFKYVILAFLAVILILGAVIVYITQVDIDFKHMSLNNKDRIDVNAEKIESTIQVLEKTNGSIK